MATRRSTRKRNAPSRIRETNIPVTKKSANVSLNSGQMEELVRKVTESVLKSLNSNQVSNLKEVNVDANSQANPGAVDAVQGPVSAVLDSLSGELPSLPLVMSDKNDKPGSTFLSSGVPLGTRVCAKIKAKILANEFIDFGSLLTNPAKDSESYQLCFNGGKDNSGLSSISVEPKSKNKFIVSIEMWTSAFQIFVAIYSQKYPSETPGLMKYGDTIRDLATRGFNWKFYDESFRYLRQNEPQALPWGSVHSELWIRSQPGLHQNKNNFKQNNNYGNDKNEIPYGYCRKYHRGKLCSGCDYSHACPKCSKNHALNKCYFRGSEGTRNATANSNSSVNNAGKGR